MPCVREGIENVQGIVLPDGIADDGRGASFSRAALVTWHSSLAGKLHQVYVNGRFAGVTLDSKQRQLVVQLPSSFESAVRLEVIGVEPEQAHVDFSAGTGPTQIDGSRVRLTLLRSQGLPPGASANIYCDNGTGRIDYTTPLNRDAIALWPCRQDKTGFGMARFGTGDFGHESAAAIGFGPGCFGQGQFGLDADAIEWISPDLALGTYRFGVIISDSEGNEGPASETRPIPVVPPARPAGGLDVATFGTADNRLTLHVSDHT